MSAPVSRRWQAQPRTAACTTCGLLCPGCSIENHAESYAIAHVQATGHEVRVTCTRLIIITPKTPAAVT